MKIINFYGGPGSGKSTMAANLFYIMKMQGYNCELINEYAKDLTWDESWNVLTDQGLIFASQHHKIFRLKDKVDYIITDSPLLITLLYNTDLTNKFKEYVKETHDSYDNINFLIKRTKNYKHIGRTQTEDEARIIDNRTKCMLKKLKEPFTEITVETSFENLFNMFC